LVVGFIVGLLLGFLVMIVQITAGYPGDSSDG
jgi:nitrate reductase NapE component